MIAPCPNPNPNPNPNPHPHPNPNPNLRDEVGQRAHRRAPLAAVAVHVHKVARLHVLIDEGQLAGKYLQMQYAQAQAEAQAHAQAQAQMQRSRPRDARWPACTCWSMK